MKRTVSFDFFFYLYSRVNLVLFGLAKSVYRPSLIGLLLSETTCVNLPLGMALAIPAGTRHYKSF